MKVIIVNNIQIWYNFSQLTANDVYINISNESGLIKMWNYV